MTALAWLRRRRWWWAVWLVVVLLLAGLLKFVRPDVSQPMSRVVGRPVPDAPVAINVGPATPRAAAVAVGAPNGPPLGAFEICGAGWLSPKANGEIDEAEQEAMVMRPERRAELIDRLAASPDPYARAVAAWLARPGGDVAALARMAVASSDAKLYSLALQACGRAPEDADCQRLSVAQWARLDPGNAAPWLIALIDAAKSGRPNAADEPLHQIANAARSDFGTFAPGAPIVEAVSDDPRLLLTGQMLASEAFGLLAVPAWGWGYPPLVQACRGLAVQADSNRQQVCRAAAEVLAEHSDHILGQLLGSRLAAQLGGPADRRDHLRNALSAYTRTSQEVASAQPLGCSAARRMLDRLRLQAVRGEAGVLRDWMAQSKKTPEDFAREEAQWPQAASAPAAEAASGAPSSEVRAPARAE